MDSENCANDATKLWESTSVERGLRKTGATLNAQAENNELQSLATMMSNGGCRTLGSGGATRGAAISVRAFPQSWVE